SGCDGGVGHLALGVLDPRDRVGQTLLRVQHALGALHAGQAELLLLGLELLVAALDLLELQLGPLIGDVGALAVGAVGRAVVAGGDPRALGLKEVQLGLPLGQRATAHRQLAVSSLLGRLAASPSQVGLSLPSLLLCAHERALGVLLAAQRVLDLVGGPLLGVRDPLLGVCDATSALLGLA